MNGWLRSRTLEALSERKQGPNFDESNAVLLHDGKRVPKTAPDIMASNDKNAPPPTTVTTIHDDRKTPRFKGGMDVYAFLSNVHDYPRGMLKGKELLTCQPS